MNGIVLRWLFSCNHLATNSLPVPFDPVINTLASVVVYPNPVRDLLKLNKKDGEPAWNLDKALQEIASSDRGVLVWIGQRHLQDLGPALDSLTTPKPTKSNAALSQQYQTIGVGAQILRDLGVEKMKLLSSPLRFNALSGFNLEVVEYITAHQTT